MKPLIYLMAALSSFLFAWSCGNLPTEQDENGYGAIRVHAAIAKPAAVAAKRMRSLETAWSELLVYITGDNMDTAWYRYDVSPDAYVMMLELTNVPAGGNRSIGAVTIDEVGDTIHRAAEVIADLRPAETIEISLQLAPLCGSIYVELSEFPDNVSKVFVSFVAREKQWNKESDAAGNKRYLTIDKIPFGVTGDLCISGLSEAGDTITDWCAPDFTFRNLDTTLEASFVTIGTGSLTLSFEPPPATVVRGIMDTACTIPGEQGGMVITEIMYAANDSEYIELYNCDEQPYNDTLIVQIDHGTMRYFDVAVDAGEFFVIGRRLLPWTDTAHQTLSALDLSSASGNWITIRAADSTVMDIAAFQTGANDMGWPRVSGKASIALKHTPTSPEDNNYGSRWRRAESAVDAAETEQRGTPGLAGL